MLASAIKRHVAMRPANSERGERCVNLTARQKANMRDGHNLVRGPLREIAIGQKSRPFQGIDGPEIEIARLGQRQVVAVVHGECQRIKRALWIFCLGAFQHCSRFGEVAMFQGQLKATREEVRPLAARRRNFHVPERLCSETGSKGGVLFPHTFVLTAIRLVARS